MKTYWYYCPRGFANEYSIGAAEDAEDAKDFEADGWTRISRKDALRYARQKDDAVTTHYITYSVPGVTLADKHDFLEYVEG